MSLTAPRAAAPPAGRSVMTSHSQTVGGIAGGGGLWQPDMSNHIDVLVVSLEQAEAQIAEFWADGQLLGHTLPQEGGELVLLIQKRRDGRPWELDLYDLRRSLDRATELLRLGRYPPGSAGTSA